MVETIPIEEQAPTVLADPITEYNPDDYILNSSANNTEANDKTASTSELYPVTHNSEEEFLKDSSYTVMNINGTKVYINNSLFDPNFVDKDGVSNLDKMTLGRPPIGFDGKPVNLHHTIQTNDSPLVEISQTAHQKNTQILHINPNTKASEINRLEFKSIREEHWKNRVLDIINK
jgi:filamentous hemagglutinin